MSSERTMQQAATKKARGMKTIKGNQGGEPNSAPSSAPARLSEATPKSRRLEVPAREGVSPDRAITDMLTAGEVTNATTLVKYAAADHGELSLTDMVASLREHGQAVNRGDLRAAEAMLASQAVALNAMFAELARRAAVNMGTYLDAAETYLRLALKAQSQSRATVETLAAIKNPPVVFARQANINNGGQQQVNNGAAEVSRPIRAGAGAHAAISTAEQTELLEANNGQGVNNGSAPSLPPSPAPQGVSGQCGALLTPEGVAPARKLDTLPGELLGADDGSPSEGGGACAGVGGGQAKPRVTAGRQP
jgi:hypothetical protein